MARRPKDLSLAPPRTVDFSGSGGRFFEGKFSRIIALGNPNPRNLGLDLIDPPRSVLRARSGVRPLKNKSEMRPGRRIDRKKFKD